MNNKLKKVLIITYYWPPAGGPGVQRVLKFVKYLPEFGWQPIILTVNNGEYPAIDETLSKEIPENLKVHKTKAIEPFKFYKKITGSTNNIPTHVLSKSSNEKPLQKMMRWIRANLFVPDARVGWIPYLVKEGSKIISEEKPDLIFSSSPPHSLQVGAKKLADKFDIKWVADFRDPWSNAFWQKDITRIKYASRKDKRLEKNVLFKADAITTVSKPIAEDFHKLSGKQVYLLTNGYDTEDFQNLKKEETGKFRICYTGTLSKDQKIDNLLAALKNLNEQMPQKIEVNFYGSVHINIRTTIEQYGLTNIVKINNNVSHSSITRIMKNSEILLLVIPDTQNNKGIVTGKLFEYLATYNYILGIGPEDSHAADILNETGCGKMFDYKKDLKNTLEERIQFHKNNKHLTVNNNAVKQYSRKAITQKLANIFTEVL